MAENKKRKLLYLGLTLLAAAVIVQTRMAFAAIAPELEEKMRKEARKHAPEILEIKVISVKTEGKSLPGYTRGRSWTRTEVMIQASVMRVRRSKSGVKKAAVININYTNPSDSEMIYSVDAPTFINVLDEGESYLAFLAKAVGKTTYVPAAYDASFESLFEMR